MTIRKASFLILIAIVLVFNGYAQTLSQADYNYINLFRKFRVDYPVRFTYIN